MHKDAKDRRLRFAPPNPEVERIVLQEADYLIFEAINRHGPLPSHYLFEFTKEHRSYWKHFQNRLTELYNGEVDGAPYLTRPPQQFAGFQARYSNVVYDLAPRARVALAEQGRILRYTPRRREAFLHQLMQACVGASFELGCKELGLRYISREEIFTHEKCPEAAREAPNPMAIPIIGIGENKAVTPDDLFAIEIPDVGFRFFAVEIDRNTESIERKSPVQNSFARKVLGYFNSLENQTYRRYLGIPNLTILTVTTNRMHAQNIIEFIRRQRVHRYEGRFLFSTAPTFGANWAVPKTLMRELLTEPWLSTAGPRDITTK